ncbi:phosphatidylethanolamine-binding protein [Aspergillus tetrazonus]
MPDVSKHLLVLQGLMNGTYRTLGLSIGSQNVTPGLKIPKRDAKPTPTLSAPADLRHGVYTVISLDLDAPFASWNVFSPAAHWIQMGFKVEQPNQVLKSDELPITPWVAANPPPGAAPHRYVFFLYNQTPSSTIPRDLEEKPLSRFQRMRFDLDAMVKQLSLGEIVAANYFVSN